MASTLPQPGVEIVQEFVSSSPTVITPQLMAVTIGAAYEVVDALEEDGTVNGDALKGTYDQVPLSIAQTDFPSPRSNIDEVDILEDEIETFLQFGSDFLQLPLRPYGDAFLKAHNYARRAAWFLPGTTFNLNTLELTLSVDNAARGDVSGDKTVEFVGTALTPADVAEQINEAVGEDIAEATSSSSSTGEGVLISSPTYGAASALTFRSSSASIVFGMSTTKDTRVEGSGFRAQDDGDGDTTSPWIEFFQGGWYTDGSSAEGDASSSFVVSASGYACLRTYNPGGTDPVVVGFAPAATFAGANPTIPLQAGAASQPGDRMYTDGTWAKSAEVMKIETSRFKLGVLSPTRSTYDENGDPSIRVYDVVEVGTLFNTTPLAPQFVWFQAQGLTYANTSSQAVAAALQSDDGTPAKNASVVSSTAVNFRQWPPTNTTGHFDLTGLTLKVQLTIDDVEQGEQTHTIASGDRDFTSPAIRAAFLTELNNAFDGVVWTFEHFGAGYYLTATMSDAGSSDDRLIISFDGTANLAFNFSQVTPGSNSYGSDVEFGAPSFADLGRSFDWSMPLSIKVRNLKATETINFAPSSAQATVNTVTEAVIAVTVVSGTIQPGDVGTGATSGAKVRVNSTGPNYIILERFEEGDTITGGSSGATGDVARIVWEVETTYHLLENVTGSFEEDEDVQSGADVYGHIWKRDELAGGGAHPSSNPLPAWIHPAGLLFTKAEELNLLLSREMIAAVGPVLQTQQVIAVDFAAAGGLVAPVTAEIADVPPGFTTAGTVTSSSGGTADLVVAIPIPGSYDAVGPTMSALLVVENVDLTGGAFGPGDTLSKGGDSTEAVAVGSVLQDFLTLPMDFLGAVYNTDGWDVLEHPGGTPTPYNEMSDVVTALNTQVVRGGDPAYWKSYFEAYDAGTSEQPMLGIKSRAANGYTSNEIALAIDPGPSRTSAFPVVGGNTVSIGGTPAGLLLGFFDNTVAYGTGAMDAPQLLSGEITFPVSVPGAAGPVGTGFTLSDGVSTYTFWNDTAAALVWNTKQEMLDDLNAANLPGATGANPWAGVVSAYDGGGNKVLIRGDVGGFTKKLVASTTLGPANDIDWSLIEISDGAQDFGKSAISGKRIRFTMNGSPRIFDTVAPSNSLRELIGAINSDAGFTVASQSGEKLVLTSPLKGVASLVEMENADPTEDAAWNTDPTEYPGASLAWRMGLTMSSAGQSDNEMAEGSGRPLPDAWVGSVDGSLNLSAEIHRNPITGDPYYPASSSHYIQYRAHRLDVSPRADEPAMLIFNSQDELEDALGPLDTRNPGGLGTYFSMLNGPGVQHAFVGTSERSAAAPEGTLLGFSEALELLESEEVYALAPLTHLETVHQAVKAHVDSMSSSGNKGERIAFINPSIPDHANPTLVASGTGGETVAGQTNQFIMDTNPTAALVAAGINPALPLTEDDGVYIDLTVSGELRHYLVQTVNGPLAVFNTGPFTETDSQSFYSATSLTTALSGASWTLYIRGEPLVITGTTRPDLQGIAETVQSANGVYQDRRLYSIFPDGFIANLTGSEELVEGYYICSAYAGMVSNLPPQQGFTNYPVTGFTGMPESAKKFKEKYLKIMAAGGTFIVIQVADGAPLQCRHQLSTDVSSIEKRELSITKSVDYTAKFLRTGLRNFIGIFNITPAFLDTLSAVVQGILSFLEEAGIIASGTLNNVIQDSSNPDTVLIDVTLKVLYPCNFIRLTLLI